MVKHLLKEGELNGYEIDNGRGVKVVVTNYGASIFAIRMPDAQGQEGDIAFTCDTISDFIKNTMYFGATVGRVCSRIRNARFALNGKEYKLPENEGKNHVHGGIIGFDKRIWNTELTDNGVKFLLTSEDGEEGYPGKIDVTTYYYFDENGDLAIEYEGYAHDDSIISLTNHAYFNLNGKGKIYDHILILDCPFFLGMDKKLMSTGEVLSAEGTPLDFTVPHTIGERINSNYHYLADHNGYDVTYLRKSRGFGKAAELYSPKTGRCLELFTALPSVQMYTANTVHGEIAKNGGFYNEHEAVCLEAQQISDSAGYAHLGDITVRHGETYRAKAVYRFSIK